MMRNAALFFAISALVLSGCASPASTLQSARATPQGKFEVHGGIGGHIAPSVFSTLFDQAESASGKAKDYIADDETPVLSDEEKNAIMASMFSMAIVGPTPITEVGLRVGVLPGLDLGVSYTSAGFRGETKFQFLDTEKGAPVDMSIGFQYLRQTTKPPVPEFVQDIFELADIVRNDFWFPLLISQHFGDWAYTYGGLKFGYSTLDMQILERLSDVSGQQISTGDDLIQFGGVIGAAAGFRYVHFLLEVSALYYKYDAQVLDTEVDVSGMTYYPAMGVRIQFY